MCMCPDLFGGLCFYNGNPCPFIEKTWDYTKETCRYIIKKRERNDEPKKFECVPYVEDPNFYDHLRYVKDNGNRVPTYYNW